MRKAAAAICLLLTLSIAAPATQKVFLKNTTCLVGFGPSFLTKLASATQGASVQTAVTNTIAELDTAFINQFWPDTRASYIITSTAAGTKVVWLSAPLSAGFTIAGTITPNIWGLESNAAANSGIRYQVLRWSKATGGVSSSLGISAETAEFTTSAAALTTPTLTPTSTAFVTGDRVMIVIYNTAVGGDQTASARTMTINFDAATGVSGDSYLLFTENLTFSADSNNAPARVVARLFPVNSDPFLLGFCRFLRDWSLPG